MGLVRYFFWEGGSVGIDQDASMSGTTLLVIITSLECAVYGLVVYLVTNRTRGDAALSWKAATIISVLIGFCLALSLTITASATDFFNTDSYSAFQLTLILLSIFLIPVMTVVLLSEHSHILGSGDGWVEQFWLDPRVHHAEGKKAPYLARFFQKWFEGSIKPKDEMKEKVHPK